MNRDEIKVTLITSKRMNGQHGIIRRGEKNMRGQQAML